MLNFINNLSPYMYNGETVMVMVTKYGGSVLLEVSKVTFEIVVTVVG